MLGERRSAILEMIIDYYIRTGEPMGSKTLCQAQQQSGTRWRF